jgi:hypothetical protein
MPATMRLTVDVRTLSMDWNWEGKGRDDWEEAVGSWAVKWQNAIKFGDKDGVTCSQEMSTCICLNKQLMQCVFVRHYWHWTERWVCALFPTNTVGIVQCKIDYYVHFIRKVSQKCLKCCWEKYCKLIYNVLYNKERLLPPDTLWIYLQYHYQ